MEEPPERKVIVSGGLDDATDAWQIGSRVPPSKCLCCGVSFDENAFRMRGPYSNGPYRYVCTPCWALPFTYFPDKEVASCGQCWLPPGTAGHEHYAVKDWMHRPFLKKSAPAGAKPAAKRTAHGAKPRATAGTTRRKPSATRKSTQPRARAAKAKRKSKLPRRGPGGRQGPSRTSPAGKLTVRKHTRRKARTHT